MKKRWLIGIVVLVVALVIIVMNIPRVLGGVFEKTTRFLESKVMREAPSEYAPRIRRNFDYFIAAFKEKKLKQADLKKHSDLLRTISKDGKFEQSEIDTLLGLMEAIIPGLKDTGP